MTLKNSYHSLSVGLQCEINELENRKLRVLGIPMPLMAWSNQLETEGFIYHASLTSSCISGKCHIVITGCKTVSSYVPIRTHYSAFKAVINAHPYNGWDQVTVVYHSDVKCTLYKRILTMNMWLNTCWRTLVRFTAEGKFSSSTSSRPTLWLSCHFLSTELVKVLRWSLAYIEYQGVTAPTNGASSSWNPILSPLT